MPKNGIFAPKGDNLELFQWYKHFKSHLGPNRIDFFPYHKVITNSVINKICNEKIKVQFFTEIFVPTSHLQNVEAHDIVI